MQMVELIIPWWRKALQFALGGIRSGFGLFPRPAQSVPSVSWEENGYFDKRKETLEVETALTDQPTHSESLPAAETVAAHSPAAEPDLAPVIASDLHPVNTIDPIDPARATGTAVEQRVEPAAEVAPVAENAPLAEPPAPLAEPPVAAAIEPDLGPETAPQPAHTPTPASQRKPARKLPAEPVTKVEPAPQPEPGPIAESAPPIAPAATPASVSISESAPVPENSPPPAPTPKPFIKLESRDNEADLSPFSVVVEQVYDGPLDLLLDLIRKQDIDIYDIPIAKITAQFLAYVSQLRAGDVDVAGEFIYTASLLIHIKSRMLLPRSPAGLAEAAEDPRRELVERLLEHERFKNAAQMLQQKQMLEAATWTNPGFREFQDDDAAEPEIAADTVDLVRVFRDILERVRSRPVFDVDEESVTVGQMIQFLARRLAMEDKPVALRRLLSHSRSERALIAMFLALLELVRMQAVLLRQDRQFSEIFVKKHTGFEAAMNEGLANARDDWK
jgi:segregation and condensation protein A